MRRIFLCIFYNDSSIDGMVTNRLQKTANLFSTISFRKKKIYLQKMVETLEYFYK
jgi:hypothetical protein